MILQVPHGVGSGIAAVRINAEIVMASFSITPYESFMFSQLENWLKWIHQLYRFRQASSLASKSKESQINMLMYMMGEQADNFFFNSSR